MNSREYFLLPVLTLAVMVGGEGLFLGRSQARAEAPVLPPGAAAHVDCFGDPLPAGAVMRLGTVRYRFQCMGLAFLQDSQTVISAKEGGAIQLWQARTGRLLREIDPGPFLVGRAFAVSRDGRHVAVSGSLREENKPGYRIADRVFDVASGKVEQNFERDLRDGTHTLALAADGKLLLSMGRNGLLRVEEVATGQELLQHRFPGDVTAYLALSADGSTLALGTGPNSRKLFVWKWQTAEEPREFTASGDHRSRNVTFSPSGKLLADCNDLGVEVRVWDVQRGRLLRQLELPDQEPYSHFSVAFSPDEKVVAAYGQANERSAVHLWESASGKFMRRLPLSGGGLAFSPDGRLLACGSRVWDLAADKELSSNKEAHGANVERIVTASEDLVITAGGDNTIRIWEAATGKQQRRLTQNGWIRAIAISPDSTKLASSSLDDTVCLWDIVSGRKIYRLPGHGHLGGRRAVAFTADGKSFVSWGDDMDLRKWDVKTGKAILEEPIRPTGMQIPADDAEPRDMEMFRMRFHTSGILSPRGTRLVLHTNGQVFVFETATGKELQHFPVGGDFLIGQDTSPDGKLLLISVYGKSTQTKLPNGMIQSTTPQHHTVSLWELETGKLRKQLTLTGQSPGPVAFSSDGQLFAEASSRPGQHIRVWDTETAREAWTKEGVSGVVCSLAFMPDGKRLVSGMEDGSALIWDLTQRP